MYIFFKKIPFNIVHSGSSTERFICTLFDIPKIPKICSKMLTNSCFDTRAASAIRTAHLTAPRRTRSIVKRFWGPCLPSRQRKNLGKSCFTLSFFRAISIIWWQRSRFSDLSIFVFHVTKLRLSLQIQILQRNFHNIIIFFNGNQESLRLELE